MPVYEINFRSLSYPNGIQYLVKFSVLHIYNMLKESDFFYATTKFELLFIVDIKQKYNKVSYKRVTSGRLQNVSKCATYFLS